MKKGRVKSRRRVSAAQYKKLDRGWLGHRVPPQPGPGGGRLPPDTEYLPRGLLALVVMALATKADVGDVRVGTSVLCGELQGMKWTVGVATGAASVGLGVLQLALKYLA